MEKTAAQLPEIKLVGITARTNNAAEFNPATAHIPNTIQQYFQKGLSEKIAHRKQPGTTYCAYTDYESDLNGNYTYFIGEEVDSFDNLPEGLTPLTIPAQTYTKFTNGPAPMPNVCISLWQKIWQMPSSELGGTRSYRADFELYDERAHDQNNTVLDIYIGLL